MCVWGERGFSGCTGGARGARHVPGVPGCLGHDPRGLQGGAGGTAASSRGGSWAAQPLLVPSPPWGSVGIQTPPVACRGALGPGASPGEAPGRGGQAGALWGSQAGTGQGRAFNRGLFARRSPVSVVPLSGHAVRGPIS